MAQLSTLTTSAIPRSGIEKKHLQTVGKDNTEKDMPSELEYLQEGRHYADAIGAFADDPMLDAMMANIRERRREMNADDNIS